MKCEGEESMVAHNTFGSNANFQARMAVDKEFIVALVLLAKTIAGSDIH
jgi:hypothetical protein